MTGKNNLKTNRFPKSMETLLALALLLAIVVGCADDEMPPPEIQGTYTDEYGDTQIVAATYWLIQSVWGDSLVTYERVNNTGDFLVGRNDRTRSYNPGKHSRIDWTVYGGNLYMCTTAYNADSFEEALAGQADRTNPTSGGCDVKGGNPWTNLTP